jgi:cysteine-rich repeat protein
LAYEPTASAVVVEAIKAKSMRHSTANAAQLDAMTVADFKKYRAIVFGDPGSGPCDPEVLAGAVNSSAVWSQAAEGNVVLIGAAEARAAGGNRAGAEALISNALDFVAADPSRTGLYVSLSCHYLGQYWGPATRVELLDPLGAFEVEAAYDASLEYCAEDAHVVAAHPVTAGIIDKALSDWGCSAYETFSSYPSSFKPVAIARNSGVASFPDGSTGDPYILARGGFDAVCGNGMVEAGEECEDGNAADGDGCSRYCRREVCGDGLVGKGEECDDGNNVNSITYIYYYDGCNNDCTQCKEESQNCRKASQCCVSFDDTGEAIEMVCEGPAGKPSTCQACRAAGTTCSRPTQCCAYANKVCEGPAGRPKTCQACKPVGKPCARSTQCCSPYNKACDGAPRKPKTCKVCRQRAAGCSRTSQCCTGLSCKSGKCRR